MGKYKIKYWLQLLRKFIMKISKTLLKNWNKSMMKWCNSWKSFDDISLANKMRGQKFSTYWWNLIKQVFIQSSGIWIHYLSYSRDRKRVMETFSLFDWKNRKLNDLIENTPNSSKNMKTECSRKNNPFWSITAKYCIQQEVSRPLSAWPRAIHPRAKRHIRNPLSEQK